MLKKYSKNVLLAVAAVLMFALLGACSDGGSGGGGGGISDSGGSVVARYGSEVEGAELTFYTDGTFVFKQEAGRAVLQRALSESVTGTYSGNPVTGEGLVCAPSSGEKTFEVKIEGGIGKITIGDEKFNLIGFREIVSAWIWSENGTTETLYFYDDDTFEILTKTGKIVGGFAISYDGDASKDGDLRVIVSESGEYTDNVSYEMATLKISGETLKVYNSDNGLVKTYKKTSANKKIDSVWRGTIKDDEPPYHDIVVTLYLYSDGIHLIDYKDPETEDIYDEYFGVIGLYTKNGNTLVLHRWLDENHESWDAWWNGGEDIPIDEEHYYDVPINATISGNTVTWYDEEDVSIVLTKIK